MTNRVSDAQRFWALADPLLHENPDVTKSTMMGLPCLRVNGAFFASWDRNTGALLVKLPATTVDGLIASGAAKPFAPAGRRFREWAAIPSSRHRDWATHLDAAHVFVRATPAKRAR